MPRLRLCRSRLCLLDIRRVLFVAVCTWSELLEWCSQWTVLDISGQILAINHQNQLMVSIPDGALVQVGSSSSQRICSECPDLYLQEVPASASFER